MRREYSYNALTSIYAVLARPMMLRGFQLITVDASIHDAKCLMLQILRYSGRDDNLQPVRCMGGTPDLLKLKLYLTLVAGSLQHLHQWRSVLWRAPHEASI